MKKNLLLILYLTTFSCTTFHLSRINDKIITRTFETNYVKKDVHFPINKKRLIKYSYPINPNPLIFENIFLYSTKNGKIVLFDILQEKEISTYSLKEASDISPLFFDKKLLAVGLNKLVCFDVMSSHILWKKKLTSVKSRPIITKFFIYIATLEGTLYKINLFDGKEIWRQKTSNSIRADLVLSENFFLLTNDDGTIFCFDIDSDTLRWKNNSFQSPIYSRPLILKDQVFVTDIVGNAYYLNLKKGNLLKNMKFSSGFYGNPAFDGNFIYIGNNNHTLYRISTEGDISWTYKTNAIVNAQPLIGERFVYFGTGDGSFHILEKETGVLKYHHHFKGRFIASPIFWNDQVLTFTDNDDVVLFSHKN